MLQDYKLGIRTRLKIAVTAAVMLGAGLLACVEPARRALRVIPSTPSETPERPAHDSR